MRALLLLLPLAAGCQAAQPAAAPRPAAALSAARAPSAERAGIILWVPDEKQPDWAAVERALDDHPGLRLTVGAACESIPPEEKKRLKPRLDSERLELAGRIPGDPPLSLVFDLQATAQRAGLPFPPTPLSRPQDIAARLAMEREACREAFGAPPVGIVAAGGAVSPELLPLLRNLGFQWTASGNYLVPGSTSDWVSAEGLLIVPFRTAESTAAPAGWPPNRPTPLVIDESPFLFPRDSLRQGLDRGLAGKADRWLTVGQAASLAASSTTALPADLPSWGGGGLSAWIGHPSQNAAWELLGEAAQALQRYQNSGRADLSTLDAGSQALARAEGGAVFIEYGRNEPSPDRARLDQDFRDALSSIFKLAREPEPAELLEPLGPAAASIQVSSRTDTRPYRLGPGWISFPGSADRTLKAVKIDWNASQINITFYVPPFKPGAGELGLGQLLLDLYIDQNHRLGAGSEALLPGRDGYTAPRDAWEYAVSVSGSQARLYQSSRQGEPQVVAELTPRVQASAGEVSLSLDRAKVRGNPLFWGYIAMALAPGPGALLDVIPRPGGSSSRIYSAIRVPRRKRQW